jgi:hypothetical protein
MHMNFIAILAATLVPLVLGFLWYNPSFGFGQAWMRGAGIAQDQIQRTGMARMLLLNALLMLLFSFGMQALVIHQGHLFSLFVMDPEFHKEGTDSYNLYQQVIAMKGHVHRTFGHGFLHGFLGAISLAIPIIGTACLYERRGFKFFAIQAGYWILSMALMGGIICAFE